MVLIDIVSISNITLILSDVLCLSKRSKVNRFISIVSAMNIKNIQFFSPAILGRCVGRSVRISHSFT